MKNSNFFMIFLILLVVCIAFLVYAFSQEREQESYAQAVAISADWKLVEVYQDSNGGYHFVVVSTPIPPTNTPTVTKTPTATPTPTPPPSFTPLPVPTKEVITPSPITPVPTTVPDYGCYGTVLVDSLNVRSTPQTGSVIGGVSLNQRPKIEEAKFTDIFSGGLLVRTDVWFRISYPIIGWVAGYYNGNEYVRPDNTDACLFAQFGEEGVGLTTTIGASADALNVAASNFESKGKTAKLTIAGEPNLVPILLAGGWDINFRPQYNIGAGDCGDKVNIAPAVAAQNRVNALKGYVNPLLAQWNAPGRITIQLENECWFPSAVYARDWIIAAVNACKAEGWNCIPTVFATGNPDVSWLFTLAPAMQALANSGMYWGMNVGPYQPDLMLCDETAPITQYTTWYGKKIREFAPPNMKIWVTESARGNAEQTVDLNDFLCFYNKAKSIYNVINFWYYGGIPLGNWKNSLWSREQVIQFSTMITQ